MFNTEVFCEELEKGMKVIKLMKLKAMKKRKTDEVSANFP